MAALSITAANVSVDSGNHDVDCIARSRRSTPAPSSTSGDGGAAAKPGAIVSLGSAVAPAAFVLA